MANSTRDPSPDAPSYEQLASENELLRAQAAMLESKLADFEERLGRNPRNSSMPPSAEGFSKPPHRPVPNVELQARKQGKQPGAPRQAPGPGGLSRPGDRPTLPRSARRVAPVWTVPRWSTPNAARSSTCPRSVLVVTEHVAERRRCRCGCSTKATFPTEATAPACLWTRRPGAGLLPGRAPAPAHGPDGPVVLRCARRIEISVGALAQMVAEAGERHRAVHR